MIKTILTLITKVLESKLKKSGLESEILKNQNYITEGKKLWNVVNENNRISKTIEEKLVSKAEQFNKLLLTKFPELSQDDIDNLRQSIAGEVNKDKEAVISNSDLLKQLQDTNANLLAENAALKNKISQIQSTVAVTQETTNTEQQATVQA